VISVTPSATRAEIWPSTVAGVGLIGVGLFQKIGEDAVEISDIFDR